ncbi:hypothetical protein [Nocardia cyriacigeorgica]|uniref:hypothetical protein n=1 Tax=Nocardia cyriacigeorgica TaxID=135487 RepID=UPI0024584FF8|nr:hypothetical protein [Nocardia cyriacigeorgica]
MNQRQISKDQCYSWEIAFVGREPRSESGTGVLGKPDPLSGRTCATYAEVATAVFDLLCDDIVADHRYAVLDARVAGQPDPERPADSTRFVVRDHTGADKVTMSAELTYPRVPAKAVAAHRRETEASAKWEAARQVRRQKTEAAARALTVSGEPVPLDPHIQKVVSSLRIAAASLREDVPTLDFCREQLTVAQNTLVSAARALATAEATGNEREAAHARRHARWWRRGVERWTHLTELVTEAYMDAEEVDDYADLLSVPSAPAPE